MYIRNNLDDTIKFIEVNEHHNTKNNICHELKMTNCTFSNISNVAKIDYGNVIIENSRIKYY